MYALSTDISRVSNPDSRISSPVIQNPDCARPLPVHCRSDLCPSPSIPPTRVLGHPFRPPAFRWYVESVLTSLTASGSVSGPCKNRQLRPTTSSRSYPEHAPTFTCVPVFFGVCTYMYTHSYSYMYAHLCTYMYTHSYTYTYVLTPVDELLDTCVHTHLYAIVCHIYEYIHTCMYMNTCK